ncbi:putative rmlC-like cupins superfamily protein-like [Heracleum sosnowskyi]|uniref:RmlC-like cupins superfamily protein-like n=1 Tax=Heracleum sosnowskyi TaxID=360622 RepID=A0AAD8GR54_9APIA|nr:putative rmlC-like cupins superfamily protein-like [Heracleum sosnowskyi]
MRTNIGHVKHYSPLHICFSLSLPVTLSSSPLYKPTNPVEFLDKPQGFKTISQFSSEIQHQQSPHFHCKQIVLAGSIKERILQLAMASVFMQPLLSSFTTKGGSREKRLLYPTTSTRCNRVKALQTERPLEELYHVRVEKNVSSKRLAELGVSRWSTWKTGKCKLPWDWHVDQLVYIEEGEVRVVPEGSKRYMSFVAGDLVRYPKWFEADLFFNDFYQEKYRFLAYGEG